MKRNFLVFLFLVAVLKIDAQVLTLDEAINIALKNSLDIEIARNNEAASKILNHISVAGGSPIIDGSLTDNQSLTNLNQQLSNGTTTKRNGNSNNALNAGLDINYVVFNGFRIKAAKSRLLALERLNREQIGVQMQNVISGVMVNYYDIVRQHSYINTIQQSLQVTEQRLRLVEARQSVGLANNADTYQAQLDLTAAQQELQSQQLILNQSKADLMTLLTQRPDSNFVIRDTIIVDSLVNFVAVKENIRNNPELLVAQQQVIVNEFLAKEIGGLRYPSVGVNAGYNYSRSQNAAGFTLLNQSQGPFLGLSVNVPIFNGGLYRRQQKAAEIDTKNATVTREILYNNLLNSAVKSWQAYQNNLQRLQVERENNRVAAALLSLTQKRFELSAATIVEVREAQRSFVEAGYRLINLAYAAKVAEVELKRLSNQLGR
jgi:outer membrane protein